MFLISVHTFFGLLNMKKCTLLLSFGRILYRQPTVKTECVLETADHSFRQFWKPLSQSLSNRPEGERRGLCNLVRLISV